MSVQDCRVFASWIDDPTEARLAVDLRIDAEHCTGEWPAFGAIALDTEAPRPFILKADGAMDFGAGVPPAQRFWTTDLRTQIQKVGTTFRVVWPAGDEGLYRITKVAQLGIKAR